MPKKHFKPNLFFKFLLGRDPPQPRSRLYGRLELLEHAYMWGGWMAKRTGGKEGNGETHRVDRETNMMGLGGMVAEKLTLFFDRMTE